MDGFELEKRVIDSLRSQGLKVTQANWHEDHELKTDFIIRFPRALNRDVHVQITMHRDDPYKMQRFLDTNHLRPGRSLYVQVFFAHQDENFCCRETAGIIIDFILHNWEPGESIYALDVRVKESGYSETEFFDLAEEITEIREREKLFVEQLKKKYRSRPGKIVRWSNVENTGTFLTADGDKITFYASQVRILMARQWGGYDINIDLKNYLDAVAFVTPGPRGSHVQEILLQSCLDGTIGHPNEL